MLRLTLFLAMAALLLTTGASTATHVFPRAIVDRPDDRTGPQVHIVYAVPSNGTDNGLDTDGTLVDSVAVWEQWFLDQTGDRVLRLDTFGGNADVTFLSLPYTTQQISNAAPNELGLFRTALTSAGLNSPTKLYGVYYEGASGVLPNCGRGGSLLGVVYLQRTAAVNCTPLPFRHPGESAAYREFIAVHELLHAVGMVPTCAPHWTNDNHVSETNDVMTGGIIGNAQLLDVGRDDYFRAHIPGCTDPGGQRLPRRAAAWQAGRRHRSRGLQRGDGQLHAERDRHLLHRHLEPGRGDGDGHVEPDHHDGARPRHHVHVRRDRCERHRARAGVGAEQLGDAVLGAHRPDRGRRDRGRQPGDGELRPAVAVGRLALLPLHRHRLAGRHDGHRRREPDHRDRPRQRDLVHLHRDGEQRDVDGAGVRAVQRGDTHRWRAR